MDAVTCLDKLKRCGVLSFATVDPDGNPQIRCISAIHYEKERLYFFTARGKAFCDELLSNGRVQILAYTKYKEMIRVSGKVVPSRNQQEEIDIIFSEQPYLYNVYPNDTKKIGIIFELNAFTIEYFNLGVKPIFRETYTVGNIFLKFKGYRIQDSCIGCGACLGVCPQNCIVKGKPYVIQSEHCLHCGACMEICPKKAVEKI